MEHRAGPLLANRSLSALIVVSFVLSAFAGVYVLSSPAPSAAQVPIGDLIVTSGTYTIEDIEQPVDGNVVVTNAELIVRNGALMVISNSGTPRTVTVGGGGTLTLEHGVLTSYLDQINPWPFLSLTIDGGTVMATESSILMFPGSISIENGGVLALYDSSIEQIPDADLVEYLGGSPTLTLDSADDSPAITVTDGTLMLFDSSIDDMPEYAGDGELASNLTLMGDSSLLAVNSYIGIDFGPADPATPSDWYTHNALELSESSSAYLYGCDFELYDGLLSERASAIVASGISTSPATPSVKGIDDDTTGTDLAWLASVDGLTYEVEDLQTMEIETWYTGLLDDGEELSSAAIVTTYSADATYAGSQSVQWALHGASYTSTGITPQASDSSVLAIHELPTTIVSTVGELETIDVRFFNSGGAGTGSVNFDQLWLVFTIGADAYIYRWLSVTVGDEYGVPIPDAGIDAVFTGNTELEGQALVYYTSDGLSSTPPTEVLDYMGETTESVFVTKSDGVTEIPFLTDMITAGDTSNSVYVGSYEIEGSTTIDTTPYSSSEAFSFPAYPAMTSEDQYFEVTVDIENVSAESPDSSRWLVVPPDLLIEDMEYYHAGDVIVASDGTLTLRNTVFREVQSTANEHTIYVDGTANFVIEDSELVSALPIDVIVKGEGTLKVKDSVLTGVNIIAMEQAEVILDGASIDGTITTSWDSMAHIMILDSVLAQSPVLSGHTVCEVTNTSAPSIEVTDSATALMYRWIHITVLDGGDYPLEGAQVYARFYVNQTLWANAKSDSSGVAKLKSLGTILTASGSTYVGQYRVNASYWSDGEEHTEDSEVNVSVMPYSEPLTENATYAILTMSSVILPDLSISPDDFWTDPVELSLNSQCMLNARVWNLGEEAAFDVQVRFYVGPTLETATVIGTYVSESISKGSYDDAYYAWTPTSAIAYTLWVEVNPAQSFNERSFDNNNASLPVDVLDYADLELRSMKFYELGSATNVSGIAGGSTISVKAELYNVGEASASNILVRLIVDDGENVDTLEKTVTSIVRQNLMVLVEFTYELPFVNENTEFEFAMAANPTRAIHEWVWTNNNISETLTVLDVREDFKVAVEDIYVDYGETNDTVYGKTVMIVAVIHNLGGTNPGNFSVEFGMLMFPDNPIAVYNMSLGPLMSEEVRIPYLVNITEGDSYTLYVFADSAMQYSEKLETNNYAEFELEVQQLSVDIFVTPGSDEYEAGNDLTVDVLVWYQGTTTPVVDLRGVSVELRDEDGDPVGTASLGANTNSQGSASFTLKIPTEIESGTYSVVCMVAGLEETASSPVEIHGTVSGGDIPLLLWIIVIAAIAAGVIGVTAYVYWYGLGKLVECGECGEFIPASNKRCPKCGVEFEAGTMKCSECGAWVPAESTECPNCGVKFVGEEIEEGDYLEKMRKEYDEMTSKYREIAKAELGRKYSDKKFEEWWVAQPTYISFEDWLAKEEEKRKEGPVACPVCGTLNPKEATVCNRCGTVFGATKETEVEQGPPYPPSGGQEQQAPVQVQRPAEPMQQQQPAPKMVIRRPIDRKVVPKKVIKTPIGQNGSEGGEGDEGQ